MNALIGEFIGKKLVVLQSKALSFQGIEGRIVDETKNTFVVETGKGDRIVPKNGSVFEIGGRRVSGDAIKFRAEDRPKKLKKKIR